MFLFIIMSLAYANPNTVEKNSSYSFEELSEIFGKETKEEKNNCDGLIKSECILLVQKSLLKKIKKLCSDNSCNTLK